MAAILADKTSVINTMECFITKPEFTKAKVIFTKPNRHN